MTKDAALKMALEALEAHADIGIKSDKAITAIKAALSKQCPDHLDGTHIFDEHGQCYGDACEALAEPEQEPVLEDIEQYRMQMAGICTAALGYWKEGDSIHPDYNTLALRDVAKLYAKYDALYKTQPEPFKPDYDTEAVLVEEMQRMAKQFAEMQDWEVVASDQAMTIAMMKCEQEPVEYQYRTRPDWIPEWNRWNTCSKDSADAYEKNPYLHDWHYEVRTLYAASPKREWVGLTDDDVDEICKAADDTASALIMAEDLLMEKSMTKIGCVNHDCAECQKPKREWVGLTDDEIKAIVGPWGSTEIKGYTRTLFDQIEAKLKEKNT